jgi:CRISPR-associated protein Csd1
MLLQALYDYAQRKRLLDDLPLQKRKIHALIALDSNGALRFDYLLPLSQADDRGKERPGQEIIMPRFPGENNGGKAYFLAEGTMAVLGRDKITGQSISVDPKRGGNPTKAFMHFWKQISEAHRVTRDKRLAAVLAFRAKYLTEKDGRIVTDVPFLELRSNKKGNPEFVGKIGASQDAALPLKAATIGFSVDGNAVTMEDEKDPLREYWFTTYARCAFESEPDQNKIEPSEDNQSTVCLITGRTGQPIARSHKPKILGIPDLASGGYVVSFAKEAPAFSSYGFAMGQNAPVSETAAAAYALAINELLRDEDHHLNLGPLSVCIWTKEDPQVGKLIRRLLSRAYPEQVRDFLKKPFAGIAEREIVKRERIYTAALSGNAGRVVVRHWLEVTLAQAVDSFAKWDSHLRIVRLYPEMDPTEHPVDVKRPPSPFAISNLARVSLRRSKAQKDDRLVGERIIQLYHAALEGSTPPIILLQPILEEFQSALVKDSDKKPSYPFSQSRFALIKLILIRNRKEGDFMPEVELADTNDPAYNCGRLLAVLQELQNRSRIVGKEIGSQKERPGAGVVERYYGRASTAPSLVFPLLLHLSRHHLSKLQKGSKKDKGAARAIEARTSQILSRLRADPSKPGTAPDFPGLLPLQLQGRFALGFYQQKAHDLEQLRRFFATKGQEGDDVAEAVDESDESNETSD